MIPGLNIHSGYAGRHPYQSSNVNTAEGAESGAKLSYEVIPVTPNVLLDLAHKGTGDDVTVLPALLPSDVPPMYRLGPGDVFFVVVWDHPEITAPYTGLTNDLVNQGELVAADGTAFYPFVGTFKAAGMTAAELRTYLAEHLSGVIKNPQVDVRIVAYRADRVEVTGEVVRPATITLNDMPQGVLQAIDACGGLSPGASRRRAILVRAGKAYNVDLSGLLSGTRLVPNPELMPGDVLHVPDRSNDMVFMLGAVEKQAPLVIEQDSMSLIQALSEVGGLDGTRGKESGILVFRPEKSNNANLSADIFTFDLSRPEGMLLASQFKLAPGDITYVQTTEFSQYNAVINSLLPTITAIFELHQLGK